jgi:hypothetical protein
VKIQPSTPPSIMAKSREVLIGIGFLPADRDGTAHDDTISNVKTPLMYHQGQGDRIPAFLNQMMRPKPVTFCTNCRAFGYNIGVASGKCGRKVDGKKCKGTVQSAIQENDWIDCPSCKATGLDGDRTCRQCIGSGWIFVRN